MPLSITGVRAIHTAPSGINLVVVRVDTSEPGLYGLGCATYTQRSAAVCFAVDEYLKPFLLGKDPDRIEDLWQTAMVSAYWRNGPVLNNAISGVDMALWDIKGKRAGMPLYQLFGGKCRDGVAVYRHADGREPDEVEDRVRVFMAQGYRHIRAQMGGYGGRGRMPASPEGALPGAYYDPDAYARSVPRLFEHLRSTIGYEVELLHDVHERLAPIEAVRLAKALEPFRLYFLEDPLPPEHLDWFRRIREQCATPIAMGELWNNPMEWLPLVKDGLVDFVRVHLSQIGGISPARKLAIQCEPFGIRTVWHGPGDVSPVGHAANVHLSLSSHNFGVLEWGAVHDRLAEVFPGFPEVRKGYAYPNDKPGLGIEVDEALAAKYPPSRDLPQWTLARTPDGTAARP
jgi:mannonate dehydratase